MPTSTVSGPSTREQVNESLLCDLRVRLCGPAPYPAGTNLQLSAFPITSPPIRQLNSFTYTSTLFDILTTPTTVGPLCRPRHVEPLNPSPDSICSGTRRLRLAPRRNGWCEQRGKRRRRQRFYISAEGGVEARSGMSVPTYASVSLYLQGIYRPS